MNAAALFIRIQQLKEAAWRAHIAKKKAEALRLAEELRTATEQLVQQLK